MTLPNPFVKVSYEPMDNIEKENTVFGRLGRYGRVSSAMVGLAGKLAGEKFLGITIDRPEHAIALTTALGNLKGPIMKVGQILATIPEAVPPEYAQALQNLQSNAPPMGPAFVKRRMRNELGVDWEKQFKDFNVESVAAASLGQVHRATLHDGQAVACKLQYPDMQSAITSDLNQLRIIFSLYERYDKAIKTDAIFAELSARLFEELDYTLEARHMQMFGAMHANSVGVSVPRLIQTHSTARLLTATWCGGKPILDFKDADLETRNTLALNLFQAWYVPLYGYGIIHGDPHPGNYTVRDDLGINLLDFGCVRRFPAKFIQGVIELYRALETNDTARAVHAYELWGFENLSNDVIETLNIWARFLYGPVLEDMVRVIGQTENGVYGRETAQAVHMKLRAQGGIKIPREFVFMDRAALGLGSVFIRLQAQVNWYQLFQTMIADFTPEKMQQNQDTVCAQFGVE